jgi:hypothetical protein
MAIRTARLADYTSLELISRWLGAFFDSNHARASSTARLEGYWQISVQYGMDHASNSMFVRFPE